MRIHSLNSLRITLATALIISVVVAVGAAPPVAAGEVGSDDFQVSTASPQPTDSRIAYNATADELLVVWTSVDSALEPSIYGQLLDATDGSQIGNEFLIAALDAGDPTTGYIEPAVAWNSTDNEYVVVFSGDNTTGGATTFEIYAQRVSEAGAPIGGATRVSDMGTVDTDGSFDASEPDIAYDATTNSYLVVWEGDDDTAPLVNGENEIFGQLLAANLTESGGDVRLSDMGVDGVSSSDARSPAVAFLAGTSARYLVVWDGDDDGLTYKIHGQFVNTSGGEIGSDFLVSTAATNDEAYDPDVAADPTNGQFMAVWEQESITPNDFEVAGALLSTAGVNSAFDISESGDANWIVNNPAVAYSATLDLFSIVWTGDHLGLTGADEHEVLHVLLDPATGAAAEPVERISTMGANGVPSSAVTDADVAPASGGTFAAVWSAENPPTPPAGQSEVWGQLLGRNADLSITKTLTSAVDPSPGDIVTYTIAYGNAGPSDASDVRIVDLIPVGFDVVSAVASDPTLVADAAETLAWDLPTLASGGAGTINLTLEVNGDAIDGQVIVNSASISSTGETADPVPANDTANAAAVTIDFAPAVTIDQGAGQVDPTNVSPIVFDVLFSESVTGFTDSDVVLGGSAGATTAVVAGGPAAYTVTVSGMTGDGTVTADIPAGAAIDGSGKGNTASTSTDNEVTYDTTVPAVTVEQGAGQADPTDVPSIVFDVVFSEDVTGFTAADVVLGGSSDPTTVVVTSISAADYTITVTGMTLEGTVTASIVAGGATDTAGNPNTASTSTDNEVTFTTNVAPVLGAVAINDVNENGVATLSGTITDPDVGDTFTLEVDWGDGSDPETFNYPAGTAAFAEDHQYLDDDPTGTPQDDYSVTLTLTDSEAGSDAASTTVTVSNVDPVLTNVSVTSVNEDGTAVLTADVSDPGSLDTFEVQISWGDGSPAEVFNYPAGTTSISASHQYVDDNPSGTPQDDYAVSVTVTDDDTGSNTENTTATVSNVAPVVTAAPNPITAQYSDAAPEVTITATDVAGDPMTGSTAWSDGGPFVAGLPAGLTLTTGACAVSAAANSRSCSWTIDGDTTLALGTYTIRVSVADDDLGVTAIDIGLTVAPEDATVTFDAANPVAVPVTADGSDASEPFTLVVHVQETQPDVGTGPAPGDINLAEVTVTLQPIGPGSAVSAICTTTGAVAPFDYNSVLTVECDFAGVPVNTYTALATVGGGYYTGTAEDVVSVFDPSLGFTTGGGTYTDTNGDRVNFGYTMKYNKKRTKVKGSLLVIRHTADGVYRLKSNRVDALAIGSAGDFSWASFTGKATYKEPDWDDAIGNYEFVTYVEDHATPGAGSDRFWITANRGGDLAEGLSMDAPATDNAATLTGGNIVVPHQGGGRRGGPR